MNKTKKKYTERVCVVVNSFWSNIVTFLYRDFLPVLTVDFVCNYRKVNLF